MYFYPASAHQNDASSSRDVQINKHWDKLSNWIFTMFQYVRPLPLNKLHVQSNIHASLRASNELGVLYDQEWRRQPILALHGIHPTWERGGKAEAHSSLSVRLRASHLILNIEVPKHLLLLLKRLHPIIVQWFGSFHIIIALQRQNIQFKFNKL